MENLICDFDANTGTVENNGHLIAWFDKALEDELMREIMESLIDTGYGTN